MTTALKRWLTVVSQDDSTGEAERLFRRRVRAGRDKDQQKKESEKAGEGGQSRNGSAIYMMKERYRSQDEEDEFEMQGSEICISQQCISKGVSPSGTSSEWCKVFRRKDS